MERFYGTIDGNKEPLFLIVQETFFWYSLFPFEALTLEGVEHRDEPFRMEPSE